LPEIVVEAYRNDLPRVPSIVHGADKIRKPALPGPALPGGFTVACVPTIAGRKEETDGNLAWLSSPAGNKIVKIWSAASPHFENVGTV